MTRTRVLTTLGVLSALTIRMTAQDADRSGTPLTLRTLQQEAINLDPRLKQLQLETMQTELRLRNIEAERRPSITAAGQAQYQSDVPTAPLVLPGGQPLFSAAKDTYDASFRVDQRVRDATIAPRLAAERAGLAEAQARVRTTLFGLRQEVNDAFFAAALLQGRLDALTATLADLQARLGEMNARVREGTALGSESAMLEATLLQRQQDEGELRANRRAALARLERLVGRTLSDTEALSLPQLDPAVATARRNVDAARARPEYAQFARAQERLARQQEVVRAQEQPRVSAFARVGYGRPGLNFISREFETYGVMGLNVEWKVWTWGIASREREALRLQQQMVAADEAAFARGLGRATENDLATIDRLEAALALDDRIIMLRDAVERSTQARLQEGVVTAAEYVSRNTELLDARFARATHQVELAQANARFLTTLGLEVQ